MLTFIILLFQRNVPNDTTNGHGGAEKDQSETDQTMLRPLSMNNIVIADDQASNPYVDLQPLLLSCCHLELLKQINPQKQRFNNKYLKCAREELLVSY